MSENRTKQRMVEADGNGSSGLWSTKMPCFAVAGRGRRQFGRAVAG